MAINYTKINNGAGWDTTSYVNPTNLNHMESGIKSACDGVDSIVADCSKKCEMDELKYLGWVTPREYTGTRSSTNDDGVFIQRVGRVDLGSLSWTYYSDYGFFYSMGLQSLIAKPSNNTTKANIYCSALPTDTYYIVTSGSLVKGISCSSDGTLGAKNTSFTDATQFRTAMSGTYLYYELSSPVEWSEGSEVVNRIKHDDIYSKTSDKSANVALGYRNKIVLAVWCTTSSTWYVCVPWKGSDGVWYAKIYAAQAGSAEVPNVTADYHVVYME